MTPTTIMGGVSRMVTASTISFLLISGKKKKYVNFEITFKRVVQGRMKGYSVKRVIKL